MDSSEERLMATSTSSSKEERTVVDVDASSSTDEERCERASTDEDDDDYHLNLQQNQLNLIFEGEGLKKKSPQLPIRGHTSSGAKKKKAPQLPIPEHTSSGVKKKKPPRLPIPGQRNIMITSALSSVNNAPHLGNIIASVLSADVFARYCRNRRYNTIYISGTDDYGTATETKALEENSSPQEICEKYHAIHRKVYEWFDISFDEFGRTSAPQQTEVCHAIFKKLIENNWLSENTMQQLYCNSCQCFLADRLVEGTCPTPGCNYEFALGDQCEHCGKLLNPTELKDPRCKVCRNPPQIRNADHLFLELPLLKNKLEAYIDKMSVVGSWSQNAIQVTNDWLKEGLKSRCITRDVKWGVHVPHEKYKDQVFYVWFDAPIGYISITSAYTSDWDKWWKNPENVELYQFMGKDNVPFHTVMFPSTLLGTGENWTFMKTISVTEYLNYEAGKFSKCKGVGVFGNDAKDTNIPTDVWRYYLLRNRPEVSDTLFTWADLQAKLNGELLNNLGNFINRVLSFIAKDPGSGYGSVLPDAPDADSHSLTKALAEKVGSYVENYTEAMEQVKLKQGLKIAMNISSEGNAYLQESQYWKLYKEDSALCSIVMKTSAGLVYLLASLLEPFMPSFSVEVLKQLNLPPGTQFSLDDSDIDRAKRPWDILPSGHKIGTPNLLFRELKDDEVEIYRVKFAGNHAERIVKADADAKTAAEQLKRTKISGSCLLSAKEDQDKFYSDVDADAREEGLVPRHSRLGCDFHIQASHGYGAFGVVFKCKHKLDGTIYAIKRVPVTAEGKTPMEIVALARLHHPYIVRYHQVWIEDYVVTGYTPPRSFDSEAEHIQARNNRCYYIQMQYCSGKLKNHWEGRKFEMEKAWRIFMQIVEAIHYVHTQGICHCDVTADNILFDSSGDVRLCDFGLAQFGDPTVDRNCIEFDPLTYLGNPSYRAPELLNSRTVTRKVDIYSIGVLLFDIFDSCVTETERLPKISALKEEGELPSSLASEYGYVKHLLLRMVAKNADDRPCTTEILEALSSKKIL